LQTGYITLQTEPTAKRVLRNVERLLLLVGLAMMTVFLAAIIYGVVAFHAERVLFRAATDSRSMGNLAAERFPIDFRLWSPQRITYYRQALGQHFKFPLAVLRISSIGLEVPVLEGTDDSALNLGVGHISGTAIPGQEGTVGIAGHRDSFFRVLRDIAVGDTIELEAQGGTYEYKVRRILVVAPTDVTVLQPRATPSLTLVTCYPFYFVGSAPKRYIVEASLHSAATSTKNNTKSLQEISQ
jgi:sortase A